jgi:hypothetical protein
VLLAIAAFPSSASQLDVDTVKEVATITGLSPADVRMRLAGLLPRVLLTAGASETSAENSGLLETAAAALTQRGFHAITLDPAVVPDDGDRIRARRIEIGGGVLRVWDATGRQHDTRREDLWLFQKGVRVATEERMVTRRERHLDLGRAVLSGGLLISKSTTKTQTVTSETRDPFLLVQRAREAGDFVLYERQLDYRSLGAGMQSSSHANFETLIGQLQAFAPGAPLDDRVGRPGFVKGLPQTSADPLDLALHLVALARLGRP